MLRAIRKEKGLTQAELSEMSGQPLRTIQDWEIRGVEHGTVAKVKAVADVLGCKVDGLIQDR